MADYHFGTVSENRHQLTESKAIKTIYCLTFMNKKITFMIQFFEP